MANKNPKKPAKVVQSVDGKIKPKTTGLAAPERSYIPSECDELKYSIKVTPTEIHFSPQQHWVTLHIINTGNSKLCFKVSVPDPRVFSVYPQSGFIEKGSKTYVAINRKIAIDHNDMLILEFGPDTGVAQAAILFDDRYVDSDRLNVPIYSIGGTPTTEPPPAPKK